MKIPSPCVDVCKFKRKGHCIACSMTERQKAMLKKITTPKEREAFVHAIHAQQLEMGGYAQWPHLYARKLKKKGVDFPAFSKK